MVDPLGLCARPSLILFKAFQEMRGGIIIGNHKTEGDARSIMDILILSAAQGSTGYPRFPENQPAALLKNTMQVIRIWEANNDE